MARRTLIAGLALLTGSGSGCVGPLAQTGKAAEAGSVALLGGFIHLPVADPGPPDRTPNQRDASGELPTGVSAAWWSLMCRP